MSGLSNKADIGLVLALIQKKIQDSTTSIVDISPTAEGNGFIFTMSDGTKYTVVLSDMASQEDIDKILNINVEDENSSITIADVISDNKNLVTEAYVTGLTTDLQSTVDEIKTDVTTLQIDVTSNASSIDGINDIKVEEYDGTSENTLVLENFIGNDKSLVSNDYLENKLTTINDSIDETNTNLDDLTTEFNTLVTNVEHLEDIEVLNYDDTTVVISLADVYSDSEQLVTANYLDFEVNTINTTTANLQEQINTNKADIVTVQQDVLTLEKALVLDYDDDETTIELEVVISEDKKLITSDLLDYKLSLIDSATDELVSEIATLTTQVGLNTTQISENTTQITTNTENIATNTTNIAENSSNISVNTSNIAENKTNITTNSSDIADLKVSVEQNTNDIASFNSEIDDLKTDVETNTTQISTNTSNIETNTTNIATNTSDISDLKTEVSTNTTNIATNTSDITSLQEDVTNLTTKVDEVEKEIETLQVDVSQNKEDIATNSSNIETLESEVETNTTDIADLTTKVDNNTADIEDLTSTANNLTNDVTTNTSDITDIRALAVESYINDVDTVITLGDLIEENGSLVSLTKYDNDVNSINEKIQTNIDDINAIEVEITTIKTDITTIEDEVATIETNITTIETDITTIKGDITTIKDDITEIDDTLGDIESEISTLNTNVTTLQEVVVKDYDGASETDTDLLSLKNDNGALVSYAKYENDLDITNSSISSNSSEILDLKNGTNLIEGDNITLVKDTTNNTVTINSTATSSDAKTINELELTNNGDTLEVVYDDASTGQIVASGFVSGNDLTEIKASITENVNDISDIQEDITKLTLGENVTAGSNVTIIKKTDDTGYIISATDTTGVLEKNIVELVLNENGDEIDTTYDDETTGTIASSGFVTTNQLLQMQSLLDSLTSDVETNTSTIATNTADILINKDNITTNTTNITTNTGDIDDLKEEVIDINSDIDNLTIGNNITAGTNITLIKKSDESGYIISAIASASTGTVVDKNIVQLVMNESGSELTVTYDDETTGYIATSGFVSDNDLESGISDLKTELETKIDTNTSSINTLTNNVNANTNDITAINTNLDTIDTQINTLVDSLTEVEDDVDTLKTTTSTNTTNIDNLLIGSNITAGENVSITPTGSTGYTIEFTGSSSDAKTITEMELSTDGTNLNVTYDDSTTGTITSSGFVTTTEVDDLNTDIDNLIIGTNLTAGSNVTITERTDKTGVIITANSSTSVLEKNIIELVLNESGTELAVTYDDETTGTIASSGFVVETDLTQLESDITDLTNKVETNTTNIATNTENITTNTANISTNTTNITANTEKIAENTTNITNNTTDIEENKENINKNTIDIATNTGEIADLKSGLTNLTADVDVITVGENITAGSNITIIKKTDESGYILSANASTGTTVEKPIVQLVLNDSGSEMVATYDDSTTSDIASSGFVSTNTLTSSLEDLKTELEVSIESNTTNIETLTTKTDDLEDEITETKSEISSLSTEIEQITIGENVTAGNNISIVQNGSTGYTINSTSTGKLITETTLNDDGDTLTFIYDDASTSDSMADGFVSQSQITNLDDKVNTNSEDILEIFDLEILDYDDGEVTSLSFRELINSGANMLSDLDTWTLGEMDVKTLSELDGELKSLVTSDYLANEISAITTDITNLQQGTNLIEGTGITLIKDTTNNTVTISVSSDATATTMNLVQSATSSYYNSITEAQLENGNYQIDITADETHEVKFIATRDFNMDDKYSINGVIKPVVIINGNTPPDGIWIKNAPVVLGVTNDNLWLMNGMWY